MPNVDHNYSPKEVDNSEGDTTASYPSFNTPSPPPVTPPPPAPAPGHFPEPDPEPARVPEATARGEASEGADNVLRASHLPSINTHLVSVQEKNHVEDKKLNKSGGTKNGQLTAATTTTDKRSLQIVERVVKLPIVKCTANVYDFLKTNSLTGWTVNLAETTAKVTLAPAMYLASTLVSVCNAPIHCVDATLCLGLHVVEAVFPCVKVNPNQMYTTTTTCVAGCLCCCPRAVCSTVTKMFPESKEDVS